jgi:hypothetical protein
LFNIIEINKSDQFFGLRHRWNKVLERSRDKNVFLTWEYLSTYWKHFGKDKKLRILCAEDKDEVIAIAPLRQSYYGFMYPLGYNVVEPLGYRGLMPEGADYTGFILVEKEAECLKLFLNYLIEHNDWDFIYLFDVPGTSVIPDLLQKVSTVIPKFEFNEGAICPYIPIPSSMDIFMSGLSRNFRKNLRKRMMKLKNDYKKVELKRYDEFGSVEKAMKMFFELHQKRWKSKHVPGVFNTQEVRNFYIDVAKLFAENGWLALYFLTANDEPIAAQYAFEYDQKMYSCLPAFNPDYHEYSIGNLLRAKIIEKCIERKIKEYDFLKGGELYKFDWTAKYRRNFGIKFVNNKFTSNLLNWGIRTVKQTKINRLIESILSFQ